MGKIELIPCPFCGSEEAPQIMTLAEINCRDVDDLEYEFEAAFYAVVCHISFGGCGCSTGQLPDSPEGAAELWNRRA